jgi:hypothetical protein
VDTAQPAPPTCSGSSGDVECNPTRNPRVQTQISSDRSLVVADARALFVEALGGRSTSVGVQSTHDFAHADIVMVTVSFRLRRFRKP